MRNRRALGAVNFQTKIILASGSGVRRRLLADAGVRFVVEKSNVEEVQQAGESPQTMGARFAREKALAIAASPKMFVIGADQVGVCGESVLRKCFSKEDAAKQLRAMSGNTHHFFSYAVLVRDRKILSEVSSHAAVTFRAISDEELTRYLTLGEWKGSAGSYHLEGYGARFVERLEGNESAVLGLPLFSLLNALHKARAL